MGLIAYVFPVLLVGTFAVSNRGNRVATVKLVAMILFDLFLCMLIELLTKGSAVDGAAAAYSYSFEHRTGGGFIGGLLAWIFCEFRSGWFLCDRCDHVNHIAGVNYRALCAPRNAKRREKGLRIRAQRK